MEEFETLDDIAKDLRDNKLKPPQCENCTDIKECAECKKLKKYLLLFAYNGIGKTRLSMKFKDIGKNDVDNKRDTLYFNAYTEDLFFWDNDLKGDTNRYLKMIYESRFFAGFNKPEIRTKLREKIKKYLNRYADIRSHIHTGRKRIMFSRENEKNIKISRGEQNIFIWCLFLAILELVLEGDESYKDINYIYIDDPISSLDDDNAVSVAIDLVSLLKKEGNKKEVKTIISSHHGLFFNVLYNQFYKDERAGKYFLTKDKEPKKYHIRAIKKMGQNRFFPHHLVMLGELHNIIKNNKPLYTYHFNILRAILEKTAIFLGFSYFKRCIDDVIEYDGDTNYARLIERILHISSHGTYPMYGPEELSGENRELFEKFFNSFIEYYEFDIAQFKTND